MKGKLDHCPPCETISGRIVPVGTVGYRFDPQPPHVISHGVAGDHLNLLIANQNPEEGCKCFWAPQNKAVPPPPQPQWIEAEPFKN